MAEEIVTLGIEVKTDGVKQGAESLDKLAASGAKAEKSSAAMADSAAKANAQIAAMAQRAGAASASVDNLNRSLNSNTVSNLARDASASDKAISSIAGSSAKVNAQLGAMAQGASSAGNAINGINSAGLASVAKEAEKASVSINAIAGAARATAGGSFFSGLGAAATGAAGGLMAVAAAFGAVQLAQVAAAFSIKDTADELNKLSQRTGITVEKLSELRYAGELSDVSMSEITMSFKLLANKMQEAAKGSGAAYEAFRAMGVSVKDANGNLRAADEVLGDVADKFKGYNDGAAKAALANDIFGRSGEKLIPLLNQGRDGMRDSAEEARKLGVVYSTELAKKSEELNDNLTRLKFGFEGLKIYLASDMMPTLANIASQLVEGAKAAGGFGAALMAMGTINPFKSTSSNIKSIQGDLAKMEQDLKDYGYIDDQAYKRKKAQLDYLKTQQVNDAVASSAGDYSNEGRGRATGDGKTDAPIPTKEEKPPKPKRVGGGRSIAAQASEEAKAYEQAMKSFADIARDADKSTLDLSGSQQKLYDLMTSANWAKMPDAWKQTAINQFEAARAAELNAKFLKDVEAQSIKNFAANQAMFDQTQTLQKQAELYGMTASQISVMEEARLEDAIALATQNGAYPEHIAFLEQELAARKKLNAAYEENDIKRLLSGTKSQENKRKEADRATLDRGLASGKITKDEYDEAIAKFKESTDEMSEFSKQAARNMQDAMADLFINPTKDGFEGLAESFAKTVQKMAAQALAANIMNSLFGDMGKTGKIGTDSIVGTGINWLTTAFGFHDGGTVGAGDHSFTRMVPASLFNNAPRFHSGGVVGDEVPIIAKKGELVLTEEQQRQALNAAPQASQQAQNIRIINAFDNSVIGDYLGSAAGEKVIMNAVQRNANAFRQAVA